MTAAALAIRPAMCPDLRLVADAAPAQDFADAMSAVASSVVVVTCRIDGRPWGMTVTAFASVSVDPPTVLVSLGSESVAAREVAAAGRFGVSVLDQSQDGLARFASKPGAPKFLEPFVDEDLGASPVVAGSLADLDCEVVRAVPVADHTVFAGRVAAIRVAAEGAPLLYQRRRYRTLEGSSRWRAS